jgi:ribosomal protein L30E
MEEQKVMSQRDAIYKFITEAIGSGAILVGPGQTVKEVLTPETKRLIKARLLTGMRLGEIAMKKQMIESKLRIYCSTLLIDALNKDKRYKVQP